MLIIMIVLIINFIIFRYTKIGFVLLSFYFYVFVFMELVMCNHGVSVCCLCLVMCVNVKQVNFLHSDSCLWHRHVKHGCMGWLFS